MQGGGDPAADHSLRQGEGGTRNRGSEAELQVRPFQINDIIIDSIIIDFTKLSLIPESHYH